MPIVSKDITEYTCLQLYIYIWIFSHRFKEIIKVSSLRARPSYVIRVGKPLLSCHRLYGFRNKKRDRRNQGNIQNSHVGEKSLNTTSYCFFDLKNIMETLLCSLLHAKLFRIDISNIVQH